MEWMIPPIFRKKKHRRMIPSVANGQRFFHLSQLQRRFCHENYLIPARTQLFHQLPLPKCSCIRGVNVHREPSGTAWLLWPFCTCEIFRKQNLCWVQSLMEATLHENWISWKFNPRNISPTNISASTVCTDCLHITTSTLHLTHKISIHSDKLCVVPYIDIDHVQLVMLPDHTLC